MRLLSKIAAVLGGFIAYLIGRISWQTPPWIKYLQQQILPQSKVFWNTLLFIFIATIGLIYWYQHRPTPTYITATIVTPKLTPNQSTLDPDALIINFGITQGSEFLAQSVAPLSLVGKNASEGVSINPAMAGTWTWSSDNQLSFKPDTDWQADQTYTITFQKKFFSQDLKTKFAKYTYSFTTLPFTETIDDFKFYQDPLNPATRFAVATINFSHPVNTQSLEKHLSLYWQSISKSDHVPFTLTYDANKRVAYLHSDTLALPQNPRYLELTLNSGITAASGALTKENVTKQLLVPDAGSFFKVTTANSSIVRNQNDRPEQILTLETSLGVTEKALQSALHVYVLPQNYPATTAEKEKPNYVWQDPGEVSPAILASATALPLTAIPADRDYATLHSYQYQAKTPSYLYVKLDKGTRAFGDLTLANDYTAIIKVPEFPQEISFLHKGALLALGTDEKLSVSVRGVAQVKFDIARVLPDDINHLITQTGGDFSNPYFINYNFTKANISEIFSETQNFDVSNPGKAQYSALNLKKYLANNKSGPLGLFLLEAAGWDELKQTTSDIKANRLILITDLGLIVKDNLDGSHDVFVQSINNGTPVNNATVAILGKNGLPILTRNTNSDGRANFPTLNDFINEREPTVYVVHNGNDVSFIPYNRYERTLNYSRFDIGGVTIDNQNQTALDAFVFSDRGIYRPGDTAHIAMIVKQPFVMPQPQGLPLEVTVVDPRGVTVKDEKISLNDTGYFTLDFATNPTSLTGTYHVNLYIVKDNHLSNLIGATTIRVNEFLPDRMRISEQLSIKSKGWVSPNELKSKVGLWNLYGAPAANHKIAGKILLTPKAVTFKEYPDYTFLDPLFNPKNPPKVFSDSLTDTTTNDEGLAELDLKLDRFEKATYELTVFAEGFEAEGGRSVTTETSALVSPLPYLVGYKADGALQYINQNAARSIHFIAINPELNAQALSDLKINLYNLKPVTTLVKKDDGTYQYESIIQTTEVSSKPFAIAANGSDYTLPANEIGDYQLEIVDKNNLVLSRLKFSIVGNSQALLPKNAELSIKLNKAEYKAGDEIEMEITAPYTGAGLITIERDKVYATQWFKTATTTSVQKIRLPADFQGNGYINVAFVRDLNSAEIYMSPLSYSIAPFAVSHADRDIKVNLSIPTLALPGQPFTITYQTDKPAKIIVFAVDEGILQVTKFTAPDPASYFFQKHALQVTTQQIVDQILPRFIAERELSSVGGDDGEAYLNKNLNPFKRKTDAPVVFWSGIIDADNTPKEVIYPVPDYFNGTLHVMAVAVASNAVGSADKSAEIRGNFVINPNVPTFVAPGDEFIVTTSVANNIADSIKANVDVQLIASSQLEIIGAAKQTVVIPEGQEASVQYKIRAKADLGSAELKFIASAGDKTSHIVSTLSVRPASPYFTSLISGYTTEQTKSLTLDRALYPEYRSVEAAVSSSPLILVTGLQNYLAEYPYGCVEQLVSKAFPWLAMANQPWFADDSKNINEKIQETIQLLSQRQMSNGAFNYWPDVGTTNSNDFASVYAMHFLTEARAQGYNVSDDVYSAGISFLKEYASQEISNLDTARIHAYVIYILTRNEIVTTNYLTHLQLALEKNHTLEWKTDITSAYIAATYQLLKSTADAEKIIAYFQPEVNVVAEQTDFNNQYTVNAQYLYLLAKHFPERLQQVDMKVMMSLVNALNDNSMSTILSGYTSLALATYNQYYSPTTESTINVSETLADKSVNTLSASNGLYQTAHLTLDAKQVNFTNPTKQTYFYQLSQSGFDKTAAKSAVNHGIEVVREYRDATDVITKSVGLGDEITVHIRARAIDNQYHSNISIVDLLPGGFEVVRDSITTDNMDYVDAREDRVIYFGGLSADSKEIVYRIKATNIGQFIVPPLFASAMYEPMIRSLGVPESIAVIAK